ncbi:Hypp8841 [Branchiostoma lanceolatum]|uniref:Hypp8841 protein n=1 Tax=Branchiostoma lanceolatum TaxID=7740 RepID=A0A8J9ZB95_BRALA|nr:Hypp8841 [Branchiostoma lanceolatum]
MEKHEQSTAPVTSDGQLQADRDGGPPRTVLLTSVHTSTLACGVPVTTSEPQDQWRHQFSVPLDQGRWALLYKLQPYNLGELEREGYVVLTREDLNPDTVQAVEQARLSLFVDSSVQHIDTGIRTQKKYDTQDGNVDIVLSRREINLHIDPIVLTKKEDPMLPRPMHKGHLIADSGQRLDRGEKLGVARVLGELLQPIPTSTLEPIPVRQVIRQLLEHLCRTSSRDCGEPYEAYYSPAMAETMLMVYYRHRRRGCNGACHPCDTVDAMITHVLEVCNNDHCPQRQFLVSAFAKHVREASCGAECFIPFCGQVNFLVRPGDDVTPSVWLSRIVVEKMKCYSGFSAHM